MPDSPDAQAASIAATQPKLTPAPRGPGWRDPEKLLSETLAACASGIEKGTDFWIFAYGSLIWKPEFDFTEQRLATANGWHRALQMWSRLNRGTPECPGLVFALLPGGSCKGMAFRVPAAEMTRVVCGLWPREMVTGVYDPRFIGCRTAAGRISALAFTLQRSSPSYTGPLDANRYAQIFGQACGRFGTTLAYARATHEALQRAGIQDQALARLLNLADATPALPEPFRLPRAATSPSQ
jgi:glutathione-specific gamma-glutamylcyclotransferase